jgi:hypothetical protein
MESNIVVAVPRLVVTGNSSSRVEGRCQVVFRPQYLVVPRHIGRWFEIVDVKVGGNSQFHGVGSVPAGCFSGDLDAYDVHSDPPDDFLKKVSLDMPVPLRFDVCRPGDVISVEVANVDASARNFHCAFYGFIVE